MKYIYFSIIITFFFSCFSESKPEEILIDSRSDFFISCKPKDTTSNAWGIRYVNTNDTSFGIVIKGKEIEKSLEYKFDCSTPKNIIPHFYWGDSINLCLRRFCGVNCIEDIIINNNSGRISKFKNVLDYTKEKDFVILIDERNDNNIVLKSILNKKQDRYYKIKVRDNCQTIIECIDSTILEEKQIKIYSKEQELIINL